jgi:hypothetical protein
VVRQQLVWLELVGVELVRRLVGERGLELAAR